MGTSANGLDALRQLFSHLPCTPGLAFVVVQHLGSRHRSVLVELARHTAMPVVEAAEGMRPQPDHVHVIAPGTLLTVEGGVFVTARTSARPPIDTFFRSLAADRGERAVGIVLSGAGRDGSAGLRAIRERGGLTLAQTPETAAHGGIPWSAIETGVVDHVLAPEQMPATLLEHAEHLGRGASSIAAPDAAAPGLDDAVPPAPREGIGATFERMVLEEYSHPCAVVDERGDVARVAGPLARVLQLPAEALGWNLLEAVRGPLGIELRAGLEAAARTERQVVRELVAVELEGTPRPLRLVVRPMPGAAPSAKLFLVVFQENAPSDRKAENDRAELALDSEEQSHPRRTESGEIGGLSLSREIIAERKATEARLAYLASYPEKNPNPIVEVDVDGRVRYANPAALRLFPDLHEKGTTHPWLSGWETVARSIREGTAPTSARVVTVGGRSYHQELIYPHQEGVVRAYGLDITERRRAEEAQRESEERLRRAQEIAHLGSWELNLEANRLFWSDEVYRIFGLEPQQFSATYEAFLEAVHPDDRAAVDAAYSSSLRDGKDSYEIVHRVVRRSTGEIRIVHEKCGHTRDASGRVVKSVGMVHDITERKRAEEALERSRQGLSRLAEASLSVMARTDLEGMLQAISEAALALCGARIATCGHGLLAGQLLVGGSARAPGAPACPPGSMFQLMRGGVHTVLTRGAESIRLTGEQLLAHEAWWGLPEGHVPLRGLLGVRMLSRSGTANGMILVTDKERGDFTEEDESLLAQLATVASLALQHVEARISLEGADRHKNQFLAMLSHELRNPLAPIRNSLHILDRAEPGGEQARRALAVIDRQVAHMTRLVDELLDVTRISRGKIQLQREPLDFAEVVRRAVEDHRPAFATSGLELQVAIPEGSIWIDGDVTRVAQVVGNLLQNASKFTPRGGRVSVSVEVDDGLGQALVRVRDTGAGIAREMFPRMFEPFTQADTTLDRSKGGLGLGLALVKGLVEMHGGTVSVLSEGVGKGAEFLVRLPLGAGPASVAVVKPSLDRRRCAPPRRVLIIEDNTDAAESLREVLQLGGHTVEVASSGPAGLERAQTFEPEVVLCDIGLPGTDGYEVARALRAVPALRCVTLVALTGYIGPDDVTRAKEAGFDHHLAKPVCVEEIDRVLP